MKKTIVATALLFSLFATAGISFARPWHRGYYGGPGFSIGIGAGPVVLGYNQGYYPGYYGYYGPYYSPYYTGYYAGYYPSYYVGYYGGHHYDWHRGYERGRRR